MFHNAMSLIFVESCQPATVDSRLLNKDSRNNSMSHVKSLAHGIKDGISCTKESLMNGHVKVGPFMDSWTVRELSWNLPSSLEKKRWEGEFTLRSDP